MISITVYQKISAINSAQKAPLYIRFYASRQKIDLPVGITVAVGSFDTVKYCSKSVPGYRDKNLVIQQMLGRITDILVEFRLKRIPLTKSAFLRAYKQNVKEYASFADYARFKISTSEIEFSTKKAHSSIINKLDFFSPNLQFSEIDSKFIRSFLSYLKSELGNSDSTSFKNMETLKKYIRLAREDGYIHLDPFAGIKIRTVKSKVVYLTEDELHLLFDAYKDGQLNATLHAVLEFFLFMAFTSLHISDARALDVSQIESNKFVYYRVKTRNSKPHPILVPISKPARFILERVINERSSGLLFETLMTDQRINLYLKEIAKIFGINKSLSAKVGRHTFATIYLRKTRDLASLKEILGHSQIRETLIYAHVLEDSKLEYIQVFNNF